MEIPYNKFSNMHPFNFSVFLLLLFTGFAFPQNAPPPPPYNYTDLILLNCGAPAGNIKDKDSRNWKSDSGSEVIIDENNPSLSSHPSNPDTSVSEIPYFSTARVSLSNFTYSFPVSAGPKFVRLYFYPETYSGFDKSASFFSVVANGCTLMSNFSAVLALTLTPNLHYLSKEFVVWAGDDRELKVTFIPNPKSYAFVNAIEVVSMPTDLYYGRNYINFTVNEANNQFHLTNTTSLETVYRLNVGGGNLGPIADTGMFRRWGDDYDFMPMSQNVTIRIPPNVSITYNNKDTPNYMAPEIVYETSKIMGGKPEDNLRYNLSWRFPVDSEFNYLVRLHFCETDPDVTRPFQRVFDIYIDDKIAKNTVDVISMAQNQKDVPVHLDFVVFVSTGNRGHRKNLWLRLHPYHDDGLNMLKFSEVLLNGVEIFKITGSDRSLAGFNPEPPPFPDTSPALPSVQAHQNRVAIFAGVSCGVVGFVVCLVLCFLIFRRRKESNSGFKERTTLWDPFSTSGTKSTKSRGSSLPSDLCRHFSLTEIQTATNNFGQVFIVGTGGFGNVYKGLIDDGSTPVAIKRLNPGSRQGAHEFLTEIEMLSRLRHLHLVSLIGFCEDDDEMILVYDYMSRGTLRDHLYNTVNPPLPWNQRLEICMGAARGLHYLHTGAKHTIIHRDVKTTNILLDEKWVAKVSDFGLSRVGSTSVSKAHVTTVVKGSFGYLDPEYYKRQHLTEKSDVYSFGVVLCEVICGKPALNRTVDKKRAMLAEWARDSYRRGTFEEMVDVNLKGKIAAESLKKYGEIAMNCLAENGNERPSMSDVVWGLEFVLQLQKTAEERMEMKGDEEEMEVGFNHDMSDIGSFSVTTEETSSSSTGVWTSGSGEKPLMGNY